MSLEQAVVQLEQTNAALQEEVTRFRDAAMGINNIWPTITEGRQNTADGKYFSVPGGGAYMRLYRRQGSSAALVAEFPDRAQVQSLVDTLGGRGVVGGSGDLMARGAFGLGTEQAPRTTNKNPDDTRVTGFYRGRAGLHDDADLGDNPFPAANSGYYLMVIADTSARVSQIAFLDAELMSKVKVRQFASGAWTPWRELYHTGNVLGTVSQSGGVPTGALIERGNNANGSYVRYADGTQECWARTLPQTPAEIMRWDFPVAFSSSPTTIFTSAPTGADFPRFTVSGAPTPSAVTYKTYTETGSNTGTACNGHAIGSWI